MTVWVLFVWLAVGGPVAAWHYPTLAECEKEGSAYKRHACVKVVIPK